jgi:hypothetical protein
MSQSFFQDPQRWPNLVDIPIGELVRFQAESFIG